MGLPAVVTGVLGTSVVRERPWLELLQGRPKGVSVDREYRPQLSCLSFTVEQGFLTGPDLPGNVTTDI